MNKKKHRLYEFLQKIIFTVELFIKNDLYNHAGASAFNFCFSIVPIVLMVVIIVVRLLNASPDVLPQMLAYAQEISDNFLVDLDNFVERILSVQRVGVFEIIIFAAIIWSARKLFFSVQIGLRSVCGSQRTRTTMVVNAASFLFEILLTIFFTVVIVFSETAQRMISSNFMRSHFAPMARALSAVPVKFIPHLFLFVFCFASYRFIPGKKPSTFISFAAAAVCVALFYLVRMIFRDFVNITLYNIIYGVISNMIIMLLTILIFFMLFFFFAQFIYVHMSFNTLMLGRIYASSNDIDKSKFMRAVSRFACKNPYSLYRLYGREYAPGEFLAAPASFSSEICYVQYGAVALVDKSTDSTVLAYSGGFFCLSDGLSGAVSSQSARAVCQSLVLRIPREDFELAILTNQNAARRAMRDLETRLRDLSRGRARENAER